MKIKSIKKLLIYVPLIVTVIFVGIQYFYGSASVENSLRLSPFLLPSTEIFFTVGILLSIFFFVKKDYKSGKYMLLGLVGSCLLYLMLFVVIVFYGLSSLN